MKGAAKIEVMFRKEKSGDFKDTIFAIFPYEIADLEGNVMSYQNIGQHSAVTFDIAMKHSVPALPKEYKELKKEMETCYDYEIKIIKRRNYSKYFALFSDILKKHSQF